MAEGTEEEAFEVTLLNKRDCKVYKVPPMADASGHKAGDWQEAIWRGACRILAKGSTLTIRLLNASTGELFAQCVMPNGDHEKLCERVVDSSRYWVLKIMNGQRHAFIGFGFSDRNDAFDFQSCLVDFKQSLDREQEATKHTKLEEPLRDLSLKEGEKITVNIPGKEGSTRRRPSGQTGGGPIGLLAPPPPPPPAAHSAASAGKAMPTAAPAAAPVVPADDAGWADFADFQSVSAQTVSGSGKTAL